LFFPFDLEFLERHDDALEVMIQRIKPSKCFEIKGGEIRMDQPEYKMRLEKPQETLEF
jgi:hypothetical protein